MLQPQANISNLRIKLLFIVHNSYVLDLQYFQKNAFCFGFHNSQSSLTIIIANILFALENCLIYIRVDMYTKLLIVNTERVELYVVICSFNLRFE